MKIYLRFSSIILMLLFSFKIYGQQVTDYRRFNIQDLISDQQRKGENNSTFLSENTLTGKVLRIGKNERLNDIFGADQVFYIIVGIGKFKAGNMVTPLNNGTIVFVPRNLQYSFYDVKFPLHVFELISSEDKSQKDTASAAFTLHQVESERQKGENVWNSFLKRKSMTFGLYMLPKTLHGDSALVHRWDEVNLVTNGAGKFQVGEEIMDINPGDIIYVKKGNPHFFHSLQQDLDILIFFEKKSIQE
jgi:mannose-6-phosphate isomerase-like protein (cupin superfamily)